MTPLDSRFGLSHCASYGIAVRRPELWSWSHSLMADGTTLTAGTQYYYRIRSMLSSRPCHLPSHLPWPAATEPLCSASYPSLCGTLPTARTTHLPRGVVPGVVGCKVPLLLSQPWSTQDPVEVLLPYSCKQHGTKRTCSQLRAAQFAAVELTLRMKATANTTLCDPTLVLLSEPDRHSSTCM